MLSETRSLSSIDAHERDAWRRLSERAIEPNPYFDVDFLITTHRRLRPDVDPKVAMVSSGGELRAVLPFLERRSVKKAPVIVRSTHAPLGASVVDLHIPLVDAACVLQAMRGLLKELGSSRLGLPVVVDLAAHRLEGPVWEALQHVTAHRRGRLILRGDQARGALHVTGEGAAVPSPLSPSTPKSWTVDKSILAHLSRSRRHSLSRSFAAIEAREGPLTWVDRTGDPGVIEEFMTIEDAGWKGDTTRGGQGVLTASGGATWFREVTDHLRRSGNLFVGALYAGERCIYLSVDMRTGDQWFGMRDVYDESFAAYSPGTLGRLAEMAWFTTGPPTTFDTCVNSAIYPQAASLYPDRLRVGRVLVAANTAAHLGFRAMALARSLRPARVGAPAESNLTAAAPAVKPGSGAGGAQVPG